jgi:hypothetical protein
MTRSAGAVLGATGAISVATVANRIGALPVRLVAGSPQAFQGGRFGLLGTSVLDVEHAVALACGVAAMWAASTLASRSDARHRLQRRLPAPDLAG